MSMQARALLIGILGPLLEAVGLLWVVLKTVVEPGAAEFTLRYVIFDSAHLILIVGILVTLVCIPVAIQVAHAEPEDVELELFESMTKEEPSDVAAEMPGRRREVTE